MDLRDIKVPPVPRGNIQFDLGDGTTYAPPEEPLGLPVTQGYGYYPGSIGAEIGPEYRYRIVHKLDWATSSSVWLCLDTAVPFKKYVAIKILSTHGSLMNVLGHSSELYVFRRIESNRQGHAGYEFCLPASDVFTLELEDTEHVCFVTDVMGPNLMALKFVQPNKGAFPTISVKRIIKQTLLALDYLHTKCHFVHTDVKPDNILVAPAYSGAELTSKIDAFLQANPPTTYKPVLLPNLSPEPTATVASQSLPMFGIKPNLENICVRLVDYGAGFFIDKGPVEGEEYQPDILRAPEITLGYPWSTSVDIWTVGCLAFELISGFTLWWQNNKVYDAHRHIQLIYEYIGCFPEQFLKQCARRDKFFDESGQLRQTFRTPKDTSIEKSLVDLGVVKPEDISSAAQFINRCLTIDPALRPTAEELLKDAWLSGVTV